MNNAEKFWLNDPRALFQSMTIIPNSEMTNAQRLNALTRLLILVTIVMYFLGYDQYFTVLVLGILLIIILRSTLNPKEHFRQNNQGYAVSDARGFIPGVDSKPDYNKPCGDCGYDPGTSLINARYEITPNLQFNHFDDSKRSYMNTKYELTPLTDTNGFRQIWRQEPEECGGYSMVPDPLTTTPIEGGYGTGQCNYIVRKTIPSQIDTDGNGLAAIRAQAESAFMRDTIDFREGIMNEHIDRFRRERQHNCPDMKLLTTSAGGGGSI